MKRGNLRNLCLAICWCALWARPAASQAYSFTKVADGATQRPDGLGVFYLNFARTTPAFDGAWVVFRDQGPQNDDGSHAAIWSYNLQDRRLRKLVDFNTAVPGGGGSTFHNFLLTGSAPVLSNGTVVFAARDTANREGLYSVPASGGAVARIADRDTADPSGGNFTLFEPYQRIMGAFSFDGSTVAFNAAGSTQITGNYSARADGANLAVVADSLHPAQNGKVANFQAPAISGGNVVMAGSDGAANGAGYNAIYLGTAGGGALTEQVNSTQQLPGNTNAAFHTRFDAPVLAFDGTLMAFRASDSNSATGYYGLYRSVVGSHVIEAVADANSTLPGLGKLGAIALQGVAVNQGTILFQASDVAGASALFLAKDGAIARAVGTGDTLDGQSVARVADPGPAALAGSGFAFVADFGGTGNSYALYYAAPAPGSGTVASFNAAGYAASGTLAAGAIASAFGQGLADTATPAGAPPLPTTLGSVTLSVKDSAGVTRPASLYYAGPTQINYVVPDGTAAGAAGVTVARSGQTVATGTLQVASVAPGLFTANGDGKGAAAAIVLTVAASGAQTWQYAAACGAAAGSCVTAPIDLGAATDQVFVELFGTGIRGYKTGITATIGGKTAIAAFAVQPQYPGMDQVNLALDRGLTGSGQVDVVVTVDGVAANTVKISVK